MQVLIPVGLGELYDKISILEIKQERIADPAKLVHVTHELEALRKAALPYPIDGSQYAKLKEVNERLWDVEDGKRAHEASGTFDASFIELARSVYLLNDQRATIKKAINLESGADIVEVKGHATVL